MHVAILTTTSAWGGVETHVVNLAAALTQRGHHAAIVELGHSFYRRNTAQTGSIPVQHVDTPRPADKLSLIDAVRLLQHVDGDVAIFEKGDLDAANWQFDLAARMRFKRFVTIEQLICDAMPARNSQRHLAGILPGIGLWWYRIYWRRFARSLAPHLTICVSDAIRARLISDYGFRQQKTMTIPNGVSVSRYRPDSQLRAAARQAWHIPERDLVVGAIGRLAPIKAYDVAIRAFKLLKQSMHTRKAWLVIVGDGPSRAELEALVRRHGLDDSVKLPGATDQAWNIYPAFDVFVMPSISEGLPHALLEAMACGCPPIAFDVGGIPEVITDSTMGWLIAHGDHQAFARALREALDRPAEKLLGMGVRARAQVCRRFNADAIFERLSTIIENGAAPL